MSITDKEPHHVVIETAKGPANIISFGAMVVVADFVQLSCNGDDGHLERFDSRFDRRETPVDSSFNSVGSYLGAVVGL